MLSDEITAGHLPKPDGNRVYFVYTDPGITVTAAKVPTTDGHLANSLVDFAGYHSNARDNEGATFYYAVVVNGTYPGGPARAVELPVRHDHQLARAGRGGHRPHRRRLV